MNTKNHLRKTCTTLAFIVSALLLITTNTNALQISIDQSIFPNQDAISFLYLDGFSTTSFTEETYDLSLDWNDDGIFDMFGPAYCVDLLGLNDYNKTYQAIEDPITNYQNMTYAAWLVDNYSTRLDNGYTPPAEAWVSELALQMTIYRTIYAFDGTTFGNNFGFSTPYAELTALYNDYSDALTASILSGDFFTSELRYNYSYIIPTEDTNSGLQELITPTTATPEPATFLLLGTGLLAVAGTIRKKTIGRRS